MDMKRKAGTGRGKRVRAPGATKIPAASAGLGTSLRHRPKRPMSASKHWTLGLGEIFLVLLLSVLIWVYVGQWLAVPGQISMLRPYSYAAIFFLSLIASASVFIPTVPLQIGVVALGRMLDPIGVGLAAGIGSGIGELTGYGLGMGGKEMLKSSPKWARWIIELQTRMVKKYAGLAIFALAAIPNPIFDVAGITAGLAGMSMWEFLAYTIAGRIVRYTALAYLGIWTHSWF